jgi:hypothetical protein
MLKELISLCAVATLGCLVVTSACADSDVGAPSQALRTKIDFDQVFADVAAASNLDPDAAAAFRAELYRAALKRINAIPYQEWTTAMEESHRPALASGAEESGR